MANDLSNEIREVWEDGLQEPLRETFVGFNFANTKFDGSFVGADTVHFARQATLSVKTITNFNDEIVKDDLSSSDETFSLTERRYFAFQINIEEDIETYVDPMNQSLKDAREGFAREYDKQIFGEYPNAGFVFDDGDMDEATNGGAGNPIIFSKDNIIGGIINIGVKMDNALIPSNDRKIAFSPNEKGLLLKSPELTRSTETAERRLEAGLLGEIDGNMIYISNQLITDGGGTKHSLAVQGTPISFGSNIKPNVFVTSIENNNTHFATIIKGATKFGSKLFTEGAEKTVDVQIKA